MAHSHSFNYPVVKIHFENGGEASFPLMDDHMATFEKRAEQIAQRFQTSFQKHLYEKKAYLPILDQFQEITPVQKTFSFKFKPGTSKEKKPMVTVPLEYYELDQQIGKWICFPSLNFRTFISDDLDFDQSIEEAIDAEFNRSSRKTNIRNFIESIWIESSTLKIQPVQIDFLNLTELDKHEDKQKESLLSRTGQKIVEEESVAYGMEQWTTRLLRILQAGNGVNLLIVGGSGVGKTALVHQLAYLLKKEEAKFNIWQTTASSMLKECSEGGSWQLGLQELAKEVRESGELLFVSNLMDLFEVGQYEGNDMSMGDMIKSLISNEGFPLITECTEEEWSRIELRNPHIKPLFEVVTLKEPVGELEEILFLKSTDLAAKYGMKLSQDSVVENLRLHKQFMPYAGFPGRPIRFFETLLLNKVPTKKQKEASPENAPIITINRHEITNAFCEEAGMPLMMVDDRIQLDANRVKRFFEDQIFGQDEAVKALVDTLSVVKAGMSRTGKPISSMLFVGPTGVGKTEMAKVLSEFMFGGREKMIRFDMSEFSTPDRIAKLIEGGAGKSGSLTSAIRKNPFCVLLFDEIEKADEGFYDILLSVLGEGRLTDSHGKLVNFCSTIIIMTSNIGATSLHGNLMIGNQKQGAEYAKDHFIGAVRKKFRDELFNRIDKVIPFASLDDLAFRMVVEREIKLLKKREGLTSRKVNVNFSEPVLDFLGEKGYNPFFGARKLQRTIRELITLPLAPLLNEERQDDELVIEVSLDENRDIHFQKEVIHKTIEENMQLLTASSLSEACSFHRRQIHRLKDGGVYHSIAVDYGELERRKEKEKEDFWKNAEQVGRYKELYELIENTRNLEQEIVDLEDETALLFLGLGPEDESFTKKEKDIRFKFRSAKVNFIKTSRQIPSRTFIYAYFQTEMIPEVLNLYKQILGSLNADFKVHLIAFEEQYFANNIGEHKELDKATEPDSQVYKLIREDDWAKNEAAYDGFHKIGFVIDFKMVCGSLYFTPEIGFHEWENTEPPLSLFKVNVSTKVLTISPTIHSKKYYKKVKPKRKYGLRSIFDNDLQINREVPRNEFYAEIQDKLDKAFESELNNYLF